MRHRSAVVLLTLIVTSMASTGRAAEPRVEVAIERVKWGFDGKAQPRSFVPLSVLVQNNSPGEFEGVLRLKKSLRLTQQIDANLERDVYVGPLSSRWVQFVPYVFDDWEQWQLDWAGLEEEPFIVPTPNMGDRATVLVYDPDELQTSGGVLHRFPSDLFPTSVTALDSLRGVVFDRPPGWQGARRQAFLDWLKLGGRVYLLQDERERYPEFRDSLSVLNQRGERFPVGSGVVRRLSGSLGSLDTEMVNNEILHDERGRFNTPEWRRFRGSDSFQGTMPLINRNGWDRDGELLERLQSLSRFRRNWLAIYGLAMLYLLALFPGCYWLGRRLKAYQWFYVGFFIVTGLFSVGFASLGRLGASDLARVRAVAVARQIDDGLYDVTGWSSAAAKVGGEYTIEHEGTGRLYSAGSEIEAVRGRIVAGPEGRLEADMPPASTRAAIHRARQEGPRLGIQVLRIGIDAGALSQLAVSAGPDFPEEPLSVLIWHQGRVYRMRKRGQAWQLIPASRRSGVTYLTDLSEFRVPGFGLRSSFFRTGMLGTGSKDEEPEDDDFESLTRTLVGNSFGLGNTIDPLQLALGPDVMRMFVYAPMPEAFQASGDTFPDRTGYVLYAVDLPTSPTRRIVSPAGGAVPTAPASAEE